VTSSNYNGNLNDIDLDSITFKNTDPNAYQNKNELEELRLTLLAEKYGNLKKNADGSYEAHDLLSAKL
jgi:hypothetical protein